MHAPDPASSDDPGPLTPPPANALERMLDGLTALAMPLAIPVTLLLFLQWPLRDLVGAWSTEANDLAQWLFALYVAVSLRHAARHHAHLTARTDLAPLCDPSSPQRSRWRSVGAALCLLPWSAYVLWSGSPMAWRSVKSLERFPETLHQGYFMIRIALLLLAALLMFQALMDLWRALRPLPAPVTPPATPPTTPSSPG